VLIFQLVAVILCGYLWATVTALKLGLWIRNSLCLSAVWAVSFTLCCFLIGCAKVLVSSEWQFVVDLVISICTFAAFQLIVNWTGDEHSDG
jgi:uncharacterized protein (DUF2062 family)